MRYSVVIEQSQTGYSAYAPDLPRCVAAGQDLDKVQRQIRDAIAFHIDGLREEGQAVPAPSTVVTYVEVAA